MRKIDYDEKDKNTGSTETLIAVDEAISHKFGNMQNAYEEGFAASSGISGGTAETSGRVKHSEKRDDSKPSPVPDSIENENAGLADS